MKNLGFILLLGILLISACNTQVQRTASQQQIANLQEGCMVVRLSKRTKKVDMLQRAGYTKRAEAELKIREQLNFDLYNSFTQHFDFCPVYFTYSENSDKLINKQLNEPIWLNEKLEIDPNITVECPEFLIAQYGFTQTDTTAYMSQEFMENSNDERATSNQTIEGIYLLSDQMVQLHRPFPYYSKKYFLLFENDMDKMVKSLNNRLVSYYARQAQYR